MSSVFVLFEEGKTFHKNQMVISLFNNIYWNVMKQIALTGSNLSRIYDALKRNLWCRGLKFSIYCVHHRDSHFLFIHFRRRVRFGVI